MGLRELMMDLMRELMRGPNEGPSDGHEFFSCHIQPPMNRLGERFSDCQVLARDIW